MTVGRWEPGTQRVVGVGAAAGGIDALEQFVAALPSHSGHAFLVLPVVSPKQSHKLTARLAHVSHLPVVDAAPGHRLEPETVVVVPPRMIARRQRDAIVLSQIKDTKRAPHDRPIDDLFASLARTLGEGATGIVLSGTGDDGNAGLRAIFDAGGTTVVNDPAASQFATYVLAPHEIASTLWSLPPRVTEQLAAADDAAPALFRDASALQKAVALAAQSIANTGAPLRVWVPGCSTGEDAYTLAILAAEELGASGELQLFGTDVDEHVIETARLGRYPATALRYVDAARRARFFESEGSAFRIKRELRARCVFVRHDAISEPPISKLHLIACRDQLGPLEGNRARDLIPVFHYALEQPGYLALGRSDSLSDCSHLFTTVDARARIFQREPAARSTLSMERMRARPYAGVLPAKQSPDLEREINHLLLARFTHAAVVVDEAFEVVQFRSRTGSYLELPVGRPQLNVLEMAREPLRMPLRSALERARSDDVPVRRNDIKLREDGKQKHVSLEVIPVRAATQATRHFLILFEKGGARGKRSTKQRSGHDRMEVMRLRQELDSTKDYLHSVLAESAATSEALGYANAQLQFFDEKLATVTSELQRGNELLRRANDDLVNVLASIDIAIVIVDEHAHIRMFTPKARDVIKLAATDIGRPLADLQIDVPDLARRTVDVLRSGVSDELRFQRLDNSYYRLQIRPYRVRGVRIGGAVISLVDVTDLHSDVRASQAARNQAAAIVEAVPTPLAVVDRNLQLVSFNTAFSELFDVATGDLFEIGQWHAPDTRERLLDTLRSGDGFDDHETEHTGGDRTRILRIAARRLPGASQLLIGIADITPLREAEQAREANRRERDGFLGAVSHELRTPLSTILLWAEALRGFARGDQQAVDALTAIVDAAHAESQLVDDLLDLALSRTDGLTVTPELLDPVSLVRDTLGTLVPAASEKQLVVETSLASSTTLIADPRRLRQIVSQLVGNAIKFTPHGGTIGVALERRDNCVVLRVHDTGPGLPPEAIAHAFEPFWQADGSTTRTHGGLGIGLSLVKHLVDRHGGSIAVASGAEGQGTTFTVRFPLPVS